VSPERRRIIAISQQRDVILQEPFANSSSGRQFNFHISLIGVGMATRYGGTVWGSNPGGSEVLRTRRDRPWGLSSLVYNGYWVSFPGLKRPRHDVDQSPLPSSEVKKKVELYLFSPSGPSLPVVGCVVSQRQWWVWNVECIARWPRGKAWVRWNT